MGGVKKKVLLVDDSSTMLMLEQMILYGEPYEIITAANGKEALAKALEQAPDLILLDVIMPEMDGFSVCKVLRETPATQHTPVIMVTTRGEPDHVENGYRVGCTDYVTKPIDSNELLTKVRNYL